MPLWNNIIILFLVIQVPVITQCAYIRSDGSNNGTDLTTPNQTEITTQPTVPTAQPTELTTQPTAPPTVPNSTVPTQPTTPPKPESSLVINVFNNLGYQWYPVSKDGNELCEVGKESSCVGGLACIAKNLSAKKDTLLSAGNTLTDSTAKTDFFKALKFEPAVEALKVLKTYNLEALVMGADIYRYGGSLAHTFAGRIQAEKLACNLNATNREAANQPFKSFVDIQPKSGGPCGIRVIGFANANKMEQLHPEDITVINEIDAITKTIESTPRGSNLIVVMGEGTKELAKSITAIKEVDLVLMSGSNITEGDLLETVTDNGRIKYILYKELVGSYAQLTVQLSKECMITSGTTATEIQHGNLDTAADQCKIDAEADKKDIDKAISAGVTVYQNYKKDLSVKLLTSFSTEACFKYECTLGSMAADSVAVEVAKRNKDFPLESRAVILPATIFKNNAILTEPVSQKSLQDLLLDDEVFYNVNLTATQLKEILETMVLNATGGNFPQLSGFRLFLDINGGRNEKVDLLHILGSHLLFENVRFSEKDKIYRVALPLSVLLRNGFINVDSVPYEVTDVFLSEALASWFQSESLDDRPLLPPPLAVRTTYVLPPTQGLCENLIAITVCYTFLGVVTLVSLLLLGYKIYSDQTAVHYVR